MSIDESYLLMEVPITTTMGVLTAVRLPMTSQENY